MKNSNTMLLTILVFYATLGGHAAETKQQLRNGGSGRGERELSTVAPLFEGTMNAVCCGEKDGCRGRFNRRNYKKVNYESSDSGPCQEMCAERTDCTGFEFKKKAESSGGECKLWKVEIGSFWESYLNEPMCYKKVTTPATTPSTTPAPVQPPTKAPVTTPTLPPLGCTAEGAELVELLNAYRKDHNKPAMPLSPSLCTVAQTHVIDMVENKPQQEPNCNLHSWSNEGPWSSCCYTNDHSEAQCMWDKPRELTNYPGNGYEISAAIHPGDISGQVALDMWKDSQGHNDVILNWGDWGAAGAGLYQGKAVVWFGHETDPANGWMN